MSEFEREIDGALSSQASIPKDKVLFWIASAQDLATLAKLYRLTGEGYYRIQPELGKEAACEAVRKYLLECVRYDLTGDESIQSRWDACRSLHLWLRQLLEMGDASEEIAKTARGVGDLFLASGEEIRAAIEQGFLEHALESAGLRPYFEPWSRDERLRATWSAAMEWADDHLDWSWNLHQQFLRQIDGK